METVRRGYIPSDRVEFGDKAVAKLTAAGEELCYLLDRGYPLKPASTFVGNHHLLSERQRLALARITSPSEALSKRRRTMLPRVPASMVLDGFNTIITLEVALSGSLLIEGMDGTIRDMAGLRGTYRIVDKTVRAVELLLERLDALGVRDAAFYLDQQVSNSGRLSALLREEAERHRVDVRTELSSCVDKELYRMENVVTSDAIILDNCLSWYNLNRGIIEDAVKDAWILRLPLRRQAV